MKKKMKKILDKILTFDVYHIVVAQLSELCMFKFDWNTKRKIN
jgi:predicted site-specific integrase-resolvase